MSFIKSIVLFFLSVQEKILMRSLSGTLGIKNLSKKKKHYSNGCILTLNTLEEAEKNKLEKEITLILERFNFNPDEILKYIEKQGTPVFYMQNSGILNSICENEGFICPQYGFKALYLSLLCEHKLSFKISERFILSKGEINKYLFIYHFYNWFAFKRGIEGLDRESQELLKKFLFNSTEEDFKELKLEDIYKLKDAIKQDKASIEFVFKICQKYESSKKAFEKLKTDGTSI